MAMTALEQDAITRGMQAAKTLLAMIKPEADQLNVLYDSEGGLSTTITQDDLDSVPGFSGLTKQQLDDEMYVLTSTIRTALANGLFALTQLASRV